LTIELDTDRAKVEEAEGILLRLIREIQESPARASDVARVRDARKQDLEGQ
jgi:hypothetical protein